MGIRWRGGRGPGRPRKKRNLMTMENRQFTCEPPEPTGEVIVFFDEIEAMRLVDLEGLTQEQAGIQMNISRGTVWRLLESGRRKVVDALVNGKRIRVEPRP